MEKGFAIVVDIGKTLSKITLWSRSGEMLDKFTRSNENISHDNLKRLDETGIAGFICDTLAILSQHPIEYIIPVAHGASVVAIENDHIAFPPIDYEEIPPHDVIRAYQSLRDPFLNTGSPFLAACLNMGLTLYWTDILYPQHKSAALLPWSQYWAWFLSGIKSNEVSSLGCHSDLWDPIQSTYSTLALNQGWADRFAPIAFAGDTIGTIRPDLADKLGLRHDVKIMAGLHDSNAALLAARGFAEIETGEATILSTGTWFIAMRLAHSNVDMELLPEARDCLVNVDPYGKPIPSARFMGGREIETLIKIDTRRVDIKADQPKLLDAVDAVIHNESMVIPTLSPGTGPFPNHIGRWINRPEDWYARRSAACLYAALCANTALDLIGSRDKILIEGRFAEAEVFVRALARLRPDTQIYVANAHNDVSFGAMRLIDSSLQPKTDLRKIIPLDQDLSLYSKIWHSHLGAEI